jgi:hypothetical protein
MGVSDREESVVKSDFFPGARYRFLINSGTFDLAGIMAGLGEDN